MSTRSGTRGGQHHAVPRRAGGAHQRRQTRRRTHVDDPPRSTAGGRCHRQHQARRCATTARPRHGSASAGSGLGIVGMRERVESLGGRLDAHCQNRRWLRASPHSLPAHSRHGAKPWANRFPSCSSTITRWFAIGCHRRLLEARREHPRACGGRRRAASAYHQAFCQDAAGRRGHGHLAAGRKRHRGDAPPAAARARCARADLQHPRRADLRQRALQAGAMGYVTKASAHRRCWSTRCVRWRRASAYLSPDVAAHACAPAGLGRSGRDAAADRSRDSRSPGCWHKGHSVRAVAELLCLNYKTVADYQTIIRQKLDADTPTGVHAARRAARAAERPPA